MKGQQTKNIILETAVDLASIEGLEGLTIGKLASHVQMSKSGLFGHFGSKEDLQLATIEAARQIFIDEVITPAREAESGLPRLWALADRWIDYMDREVFPGGCFFVTAATEFDNRPGIIRDTVATQMQEWLDYLAINASRAQQLGHLSDDVDPQQIAFELHAFYLGANWATQLFGDTQATVRARVAILNRLNELITELAPPLPTLPQ